MLMKTCTDKLEQISQVAFQRQRLSEVSREFLNDLYENRVKEARFGLKAMNQSFRVKRIIIAFEGSSHMSELLEKMVTPIE